MKVIEQSLQVLPQSAVRIAAAMEAAAAAVLEQGRTFAAEVSSCAAALNADMKTVAEQMAAMPALLDPTALLACCTDVPEAAARDLRALALDAAAIPQRLLAQTSTVQQVIDQAVACAKSLSSLLPGLVELAPHCTPQIAFFNTLPARGQALASLAMRSSALFEQYAGDLLALSQRRAAATGADLPQAHLQATLQAQSLQRDSLAQVQQLRQTLDGDATALESALAQATAAASLMLGQVGELIGRQGEQLMAPLQGQIDLLDGAMQALQGEAQACDALFDESIAQLDRLGAGLLEPISGARAQLDAVNDALASAAARVDAMVGATLAPLDALALRADAITQAIEDAVAVVGAEVVQVHALLTEMDGQADHASAVLAALPDNFPPVRTQIAEAVALLVEIQGRIPSFVLEAGRALDCAAAELDQAEFLCNHAIEVCTLYMMKALPLMLARTLFMGVKSMIPGVKSAIAGARQSVQAAGTQASALMDQAIALVQALNPLLEQAISQVRIAIDALSALLAQLQLALRQVSDAAGAIPPALEQQVAAASTAIGAVLAKVRAAADECLAQMQCEALVQRLQQGLSDLWQRTFVPLEAQIRQAGATMQTALLQGKEGVATAVQLAQQSSLVVRQALIAAQEQAQQPVTQLVDLVASSQSRMAALGGAARQQLEQVAAQALSMADQAALKIASLTIGTAAASSAAALDAAVGQIGLDAPVPDESRQSIDRWRADAVQFASDAAARIDGAVAQLALAPVRGACERASAGVQAANMPDADAVAGQVQAAFADMQRDAQGVGAAASAALGDMTRSCEDACLDAQQVASSYAPASAPLLTHLQAQFAEATRIADDAASAEQALAAHIAATGHNVGAAAREAKTQTTHLKDAAQAGIARTLEQVGSVQAQVNLARSDVIAAEAIVDQQVVKHGGTSAQAAQEKAARAVQEKAALAAQEKAALAVQEKAALAVQEKAALAAPAMASDSSAGAATTAAPADKASARLSGRAPDAALADRARAPGGESAAMESAASAQGAAGEEQARLAHQAERPEPEAGASQAQVAPGAEEAVVPVAAEEATPAGLDGDAPLLVPATSDGAADAAEPVAQSIPGLDAESVNASANAFAPESGVGAAAKNRHLAGLNPDPAPIPVLPPGQKEAASARAASAGEAQSLALEAELDKAQALAALRSDALAAATAHQEACGAASGTSSLEQAALAALASASFAAPTDPAVAAVPVASADVCSGAAAPEDGAIAQALRARIIAAGLVAAREMP